MSILGTILFFIIGMILLIVLGAWIFVRNIMRGFRDGSGRTSNTGRAGSRNSADGSNARGKEDAPGEDLEDGPGRRYYYNRTKTVDKERAEDVSYEEI